MRSGSLSADNVLLTNQRCQIGLTDASGQGPRSAELSVALPPKPLSKGVTMHRKQGLHT